MLNMVFGILKNLAEDVLKEKVVFTKTSILMELLQSLRICISVWRRVITIEEKMVCQAEWEPKGVKACQEELDPQGEGENRGQEQWRKLIGLLFPD